MELSPENLALISIAATAVGTIGIVLAGMAYARTQEYHLHGGEPGPMGAMGPRGLTGERGPIGPQGLPGKDAVLPPAPAPAPKAKGRPRKVKPQSKKAREKQGL